MTVNDLYTIDPYINGYMEYNNALTALKNNGIEYNEWILLKSPYYFYIESEGKKPILFNYSDASTQQWRNIVSKTKPLVPSDEYILYRRADKINNLLKDFIGNDAFNEAAKSKYTIVFNYKNKENLYRWSKFSKIYVIGRYYNNKYKLAIGFSKQLKNMIPPSDILLEIGSHKIGELEQKINTQVLHNKDKIMKWSRTPYFNKGQFFPTQPASPIQKFI